MTERHQYSMEQFTYEANVYDFIRSALAALSQPSVYPADVELAKSRLREALKLQPSGRMYSKTALEEIRELHDEIARLKGNTPLLNPETALSGRMNQEER